ncbi:MAG TPA: hypothetical protein VGM37_16730 [Armatimonadota bacterium]
MRKWRIVLLAALCALALATLIVDRWLRPLDLDTERAAARAAGLPLAPEDFPMPRYPPRQDAAPDWKALTLTLLPASATPSWKAVGRAGVYETPPGSRNAQTFRFIAQHRRLLDRIHVAANKPGRSLSHGWGPEATFPELAAMRNAGALLCLESLSMARQGHPVEAIRNQALGFRLAKQAAEEPLVIGCLSASGIERNTLNGMADIARENPTPAVAAAIRAAIARGAPRYDLVRSLKGDTLLDLGIIRRVDSITTIRAIWATSFDHLPSNIERRPSGLIRYGFQEPTEAIYLHYMTRLVHAAAAPSRVRDHRMHAVGEAAQMTARNGPAYWAASGWIAGYAICYDALNRVIAQRAVVTAAADALAWRTQRGAFPATLADASGRTTDPYTDGPLGYRRTEGGFVVYSVGLGDSFAGLPGPGARGQTYFNYPNPRLDGPAPPISGKVRP